MRAENREHEALAAAVVARTSDCLAIVGPDGSLTFVSPAARRMLGYTESDLVGTGAFELVHPDDQASAFEGFESTSGSQDSRPTPLLLRLRTAADTWLETEVIATNHLADPEICGLLLSIRDVSESMRTDRALRESEERYRLIVELAREGIWVFDERGRTTYANRAMARMLGTTVNQLTGRRFLDFVHEEARERAFDLFRRSLQCDAEEHDLPLRSDDGRVVWTRVNVGPVLVHDGTSTGAIALVTDVTDRHLLEERLEREARVDALTGVANRHTLFEVLARELARPELCGVLFADLDDFKAINDTYGHGAGDETLRVVAKRLSSAVREVDTVARVGGDEFVVVTSPLRSEGEALAIGDRIPRLLEEPVPVGNVSITVGLSVGIAFSTKDDDADTLLARADNAMYRAKRSRSAVEVADR